MDRYEEKARKIMERGDAMLAQKKRSKVSVAHRTAAITFGTAAVLAIGIAVQAIHTPRKPEPIKSEIVTEMQEITTAAASGTTTSKTFVSVAAASAPVTTAEASTTATADTSAPEETTEVSSAANVSQTSTAAATSHASTNAVTSQTTAYTTTAIQETTTTVPSDMTYLDFVAANVKELTLFGDKTYKLWQYYYFPSDRRTSSSPKTKSIADEDIGELLTEISVEPTEYTELLPETLNADVYQIGSISGDYAVAIRFEGIDLNLIYHNLDYKPASLEQFAEDLDVQNNLKVEFVNDNNHPNIRPRPANKDDAFAILFAEKDENAKAGPGASDPPVWLGATVIPIPEDFLSFEVRVNGYLYITTPTNKKLSFLIGKDRAKEFIKFVENQY